MPREAVGLGRDGSARIGKVRVGEDAGEVEATLSDQMLGVNGKPAARPEVENVAMMQITMQHPDLAGTGQQRTCSIGATDKDTAVGGRRRFQIMKPLRQRDQFGKRLGTRRMQPCCGGA